MTQPPNAASQKMVDNLRVPAGKSVYLTNKRT
jgi:hypothetical protein